MTLRARWLGRVDYDEAVTTMEAIRARVVDGDLTAQELLLCEHPAVITVGRRARTEDIVIGREELARRGVLVAPTSRGGEVTYHGPGQLMIYPVVRLGRGLLPLLEAIGETCAQIAAELGVSGAAFRRSPAGVWVGHRKIAACGIHIRRRVMIHGFALNLATPAEAWQQIVPCGLADRPIASIVELGGASSTPAEIAERFGAAMAEAVASGAAFALR